MAPDPADQSPQHEAATRRAPSVVGVGPSPADRRPDTAGIVLSPAAAGATESGAAPARESAPGDEPAGKAAATSPSGDDAGAGAADSVCFRLGENPGVLLGLLDSERPKYRGEEEDGPVVTGLRDRPAPEDQNLTERYRLEGVLGAGGMGTVYGAFDTDLNRRVAVKVARHQSREAVQRFLREAQIAAQLQHPNIPPLYDIGLDDQGRLFFSMRLIDGRLLADIIDEVFSARAASPRENTAPDPRRRTSRLALAPRVNPASRYALLNRRLEVMKGVCNAVAYAHQKGVIHRDLKPSNVMVGRHGEVLVMDWGIAKLDPHAAALTGTALASGRVNLGPDTGAFKTLPGVIIGTPPYMAPEQVEGEGERVSRLTDVYALGAIFYEMLTGAPPFTGVTREEVLDRVRHDPPPPMDLAAFGVPPAVRDICLQALDKDPARRYASAGEIAADIEAFLYDQPVTAHRETARERLARLGRLHPTAKGVLLALAAAVLILVVAGYGYLLQRDHERRAQQLERLHAARTALVEERFTAARDGFRESALFGPLDPEDSARLADAERGIARDSVREHLAPRFAEIERLISRPERPLIALARAVALIDKVADVHEGDPRLAAARARAESRRADLAGRYETRVAEIQRFVATLLAPVEKNGGAALRPAAVAVARAEAARFVLGVAAEVNETLLVPGAETAPAPAADPADAAVNLEAARVALRLPQMPPLYELVVALATLEQTYQEIAAAGESAGPLGGSPLTPAHPDGEPGALSPLVPRPSPLADALLTLSSRLEQVAAVRKELVTSDELVRRWLTARLREALLLRDEPARARLTALLDRWYPDRKVTIDLLLTIEPPQAEVYLYEIEEGTAGGRLLPRPMDLASLEWRDRVEQNPGFSFGSFLPPCALPGFDEAALIERTIPSPQGRAAIAVREREGMARQFLITARCPGYLDARVHLSLLHVREDLVERSLRLIPAAAPLRGFAPVPAETFLFGADRVLTNAAPFLIARAETTVAEFAPFAATVRAREIAGLSAADLPAAPAGAREDEPIRGLSHRCALAYAAWFERRVQREAPAAGVVSVGLPTEEEWEHAARGVDGRRYPWGNRFDSHGPRAAPFLDESVYGLYDTSGGASEWCDSSALLPERALLRGGDRQGDEAAAFQVTARRVVSAGESPREAGVRLVCRLAR